MSYALITGASSGLGIEFARLFAQQGIPMLLTSSPRSQTALDEVASELREQYGVDIKTHVSDLAQQDGAQRLIEWVTQEGVTLEYLVNNAGFGICGYTIQEYDTQAFNDMLQVNVNALSQLIAEYAPQMVARGSGRILNVSSISGYVYPHGLEAGYAASKAYVVSLSESMIDDLRGTGVTCTHLAPGPTRTKFFSTAGLKNHKKIEKLYMPADEVARQGFAAMMSGKPRVMPGVMNKVMKMAALLSPSRRLVGMISGYLLRT